MPSAKITGMTPAFIVSPKRQLHLRGTRYFHAIAAMWTTRGCVPLVAAREQPELRRPQQFLVLDLGHAVAPVQQPVHHDLFLVS